MNFLVLLQQIAKLFSSGQKVLFAVIGGFFRSKPATQRPPGLLKLNESVWQFFTPSTVPEVEVIFFHGLQLSKYEEAFWRTWLSRDGTVVWPKDWLSKHLPKARILSISYNSSARRHPGEKDLYLITENLINDIIFSENLGQHCPVVLVGHSLGGLIIKDLLVGCLHKKPLLNPATSKYDLDRIEKFLTNCRGVFYYSTPHGGSRIANFADLIPGMNNALIDLLKTLSKQAARINNDFRGARASLEITTRAIGEGLDTEYMGLTGRVVEDASARQDIDGGFYTATESNHYDVCKPINDTSSSTFTFLCEFIGDMVLESKSTLVQAETPAFG